MPREIETTAQRAERSRSGFVGRRSALRTIGGVSALVGAAAAAGHWKRAFSQTTKQIRMWTSQTAPAQLASWEYMIETFEEAHPGITVALERLGDDVMPKLSAAFVGGETPELVTGVNTSVPASLHLKGLCEELSDVVAAVGDFTPRMLQVYNDNGYQFSLGLALTVISTMWCRMDLLEEAGVGIPKHWDDYMEVIKKTTKGGTFGTSLPYGNNSFSTRIVDLFVRQAGGDIIAPDHSVVFNSPETVRALEFLKEVRPYAPRGANGYGYSEALNAFVIGSTALGMYTGRALINVHDQNPKIEDHVKAAFYSYPRDGVPYWVCGFDGVFMPKPPQGKTNLAEGKLFVEWIYRPETYTRLLHGAPGHHLPVVESVANSPEYQDNVVLQKNKENVAKMLEIAEQAWVPIKPTAKHPFVFKMGDVFASGVLAQTLQRVVVNNEPPKAVAKWAHDKIAEIAKS